ncbi:hypothetical protein [Stenotrophomonas humi]|uniref:hypothetical protein n=1 Tax=Stenotrophomonas humi TaxID=405444 RepID=UPI00128F7715|nr:hypothetical protein [Stenotrophomonas humi]
MERERQEPTLGKADLSDVNFRPRSKNGPRSSANGQPSEESRFWLRAIVLVAAAVLIAMGLIEWNARRQVAALERALTPTPAQQAQIEAALRELEKAGKENEAIVRKIRLDPNKLLDTSGIDWRAPVEPMRPGQRCIQGRRLERIEGGWRDIPNSPC